MGRAQSFTRHSPRAKDYAFRLISETGSPKASFAWLQPLIEEEQSIIGKDWYPYGIEANRPTIEALLQYTIEQGLSDRRLQVEELFAPRHAARHSAERRTAGLDGVAVNFSANALDERGRASPVSNIDLRLDNTAGQPSETASMSRCGRSASC